MILQFELDQIETQHGYDLLYYIKIVIVNSTKVVSRFLTYVKNKNNLVCFLDIHNKHK